MQKRSEAEMLALILRVAEADERVRAVVLNGSRVNPAVQPDALQDFDVVYYVRDMQALLDNKGWIDVFGPRLILQTPETMTLCDFPPANEGWFTYLMQFIDGNRIDLMLYPAGHAARHLQSDSLARVLLDKDGILPAPPPPSEAVYYTQKPSAENFRDCCNEFWWVSAYVAKGLWRAQPLYAAHHLNAVVRPMLQKMLEWQVAAENGFTFNPGKCGDNLQKYLDTETWHALLGTYNCSTPQSCWQSLFTCCDCFEQAAARVAGPLGFVVNEREAAGVRGLLTRLYKASN